MKQIVTLTFLIIVSCLLAGCSAIPAANPRILRLGTTFTGNQPLRAAITENPISSWRIVLDDRGELKLFSVNNRVNKLLLTPNILSAVQQADFDPADVSGVSSLGKRLLISIDAGEFGGGVFRMIASDVGPALQQVCPDNSIGVFAIGDRFVSLTSNRHGLRSMGSVYEIPLAKVDSDSYTTCQKLFDLPAAPVVAATWQGNLFFSDGNALYVLGPLS